MKLVVISDTHGRHDDVTVPDGDILIHCGDCIEGANAACAYAAGFLSWLNRQPHEHKVLIAGNHDWIFDVGADQARAIVAAYAPGVHYLHDSGCTIDRVRFWGSPVTPRFFDWAFNRDRGADIRRHWDMIPTGADVLVTHGPPHGVLDLNARASHEGCEDLLRAVARVRPRLHCFGHIHHSYGKQTSDGTIFANSAICDERYLPTNAPHVIGLRD